MTTRINKQGVRILDLVGHNGSGQRSSRRRGVRAACSHVYQTCVIGTRWESDSDIDGYGYEVEVHGGKCIACGHINEYW